MLIQVAAETYVDPGHVVAIVPAPMSTRAAYVYLRGGAHFLVDKKPTQVRLDLGLAESQTTRPARPSEKERKQMQTPTQGRDDAR